MKIPYGYVLVNEEIIVQEEKADVVRSIFGYYLAGASLGKIVDMLHVKGIPSPSGNLKWGRVTIDKLLSIAIQEIIKEYQRQKTNQRSRKGGSARKPQQYHAEAEVII